MTNNPNELTIENSVLLASGANIGSGGLGSKAQYAVAPDGRFLVNMTLEAATATPITVVLNWDAPLKK